MELQRIMAIVNTLSSAINSYNDFDSAASNSVSVIRDLASGDIVETKQDVTNDNIQDQDDELLEKMLQASKHIKKMQMTRSETVLALDGIAPNLNDIINQRTSFHEREEEDAETINIKMGGKSAESSNDLYELYDFIYNLTEVSLSEVKS